MTRYQCQILMILATTRIQYLAIAKFYFSDDKIILAIAWFAKVAYFVFNDRWVLQSKQVILIAQFRPLRRLYILISATKPETIDF